MNARQIVSIAVALTLMTSADLAAQQKTAVTPGSRIRASAPSVSSKPFVGDVVAWESDFLVVDARVWQKGTRLNQQVKVAIGSLTKLEVSRGHKSRFLRGLGYGFLIGAAAGTVIGAASGDDDPSEWFAMSAGEKAVVGAVSLGLLGGIVGGVIGLSSPAEKWEEVPLDRLLVGPSPVTADGVALSVSLRLGR